MPLSYSLPSESLARELQEVAEHAAALREALEARQNTPFPSDFPVLQLVDIARTLEGLPAGTAEGCRVPLEYARNRLPAIRRAFVQGEELGGPGSEPSFIARGSSVDARLLPLMASVSTAMDAYRHLATSDFFEEEALAAATPALPELHKEAVPQSLRLEKELIAAEETVTAVTKPESPRADALKRQLSDSKGLNRLALTELAFPKVIVPWFRKITTSLKDYPDLIRKTAASLQVGVDVVELVWQRWDGFQSAQTQLLFTEFKKVCGVLTEIGDRLDRPKQTVVNTHSEAATKSVSVAKLIMKVESNPSASDRSASPDGINVNDFTPFSLMLVEDFFDPTVTEKLKDIGIKSLGDMRSAALGEEKIPVELQITIGKFFHYSPPWFMWSVNNGTDKHMPQIDRKHYRAFLRATYEKKQIERGTGFPLQPLPI